jgi:hypothetical protein
MYFLKTIDLASYDSQMYGSTPDQINQVERHRRQNDGVSRSEHLYYIDNGVRHPYVVEYDVLEVLTIEIELAKNKSPFKSMIRGVLAILERI